MRLNQQPSIARTGRKGSSWMRYAPPALIFPVAGGRCPCGPAGIHSGLAETLGGATSAAGVPRVRVAGEEV
jgi:hypothetical protein